MSQVRSILKTLSWLLTSFKRRDVDVAFLMYHRVTGDVSLELDLPFDIFEQQMAYLHENCRVISFDKAVTLLHTGSVEERDNKKPNVVITFDDAYEDFYYKVLPLLERYGLPAMLYVPTRFIDVPGEPPISAVNADSSKLTPVTWDMLRELADHPLVTLGAHSHEHAEYPTLSAGEIADDIKLSSARLRDELGVELRHFAYPRGCWNEASEDAVKGFYDTIALVGGAGVSCSSFDPYRIPRLPVIRSDGFFWFQARLQGRLQYEQKFLNAAKYFLKFVRR